MLKLALLLWTAWASHILLATSLQGMGIQGYNLKGTQMNMEINFGRCSYGSNLLPKIGIATALLSSVVFPILTLSAIPCFATVDSVSLQTQLESFQEDVESNNLKIAREPKTLMKNLKSKLKIATDGSRTPKSQKEVDDAIVRVLTLQAYLDEAERDLFSRQWENLQVYLYTFAEQESSFATLIEQLFPNNDDLDQSAREALSFEAKSMFLSLDELREAAKDRVFKSAQRAYSRLLLSYDRFLKAGGLYPTYDPITSTAIFFEGTPLETLKFDKKSKVQVLDQVVLIAGPDMGNTATFFLRIQPSTAF